MMVSDIKPVCFISSSNEDMDKAIKVEEFLEKLGYEATTSQSSFNPG